MKNVLLGTVALIALTAPAASADLAARPYAKASPIVIPIFDWTGFYIGINGGGSTAHQCWDVANAAGLVFAPPRGMGCHNATGGTFGGQIGYGRQIANSVFDLEAQGNWPNLSGSNSNLAFVGVQDGTKIDAFGLFTGQVGYTWNNMLLYVKVALRSSATSTGSSISQRG
ncbi:MULTISPECIES: hypothetical protein [Bradyrhizobium]|uniref:hypothetical protein n=1 Tax=Bradyrhizobium TaxID=374 RepID=UPI0003F58C93